MKLALLGQVDATAQLDQGHRVSVRNHNEEVDINRHILSKLTDCTILQRIGTRGHDESESPDQPGVFPGLVDLVESMREHLEKTTVSKARPTHSEGAS